MSIVDLPATTTEKISKRLVALRTAAGNSAVSRVLTLVVCVEDGDEVELAVSAAVAASREHPCRVIIVAKGQRYAATRLDAQIRVGGDAGASEVVVLRLYGPLADHGDSVVIPFLLPDTPVVAWWPGQAPAVPSQDPIGAQASRRITNSIAAVDAAAALSTLASGYAPGDTDLVWAKATPIRSILTASLDEPNYDPVTEAVVLGPKLSITLDLVAGWLSARLGVPVRRGLGDFEISLRRESGALSLTADAKGNGRVVSPGRPESAVSLFNQDVPALLAQELRFMDPDEVYEQALLGFATVIQPEEAA
ncbi:glucose-6-phosphate dehydrogenase assembly protein OpcA [Segniliparus rugosus]|uniref:OpcA protein n=1 Tax=Segniliparus rugosus (strain ATCC BAA-974 / DSM 45345 / CCUG 50838 / CIP 108380 / JCM 13579 / CDC 945) TaxID=679197 RepID=E5XQW3_SEGRC|nr:glucose-6-phosphate dehydrogenase assembly protein OpcA [Segniliparus rugosus]EFV13254.1 opcA protein [Segniliparus rugosus ATCC BAA-974]